MAPHAGTSPPPPRSSSCASSTPPPADDLLALVAGAIHRAHDRIGELVEDDPSINGTSTTLTVALFDGHRVAIGHIGDSRAYLYRAGTLTQLTKDHTFVQSLIDEGRITEEESRVHPHRNLILKAVDGIHEAEPDLFFVDLAPGDRLFLCSDGACGVLDDHRMSDILGTGTPDYAVVEMVRASLEAGSSDNVTCIVADVVDLGADGGLEGTADGTDDTEHLEPLLLGAAADLPRRNRGGVAHMFRGHRSGDTGELEPVPAEAGHAIPNDPIDPEVARYAPRPPRRFVWLKRLAALAVLVGLVWIGAAAAYAWSQDQYYVAEHDGNVTIYRGVDANLPGITLTRPYEESSVQLDLLSDYDAGQVRQGIEADSLEDARRTVENLGAAREAPSSDSTTTDGSTPSAAGDGASDAATDGTAGSAGGDSTCAAGSSTSDADCG